MTIPPRQTLEKGPILDPVFIAHYWRLARRPAWAAARHLAGKMRRLGVPRGARILDIGCGPGLVTRGLARRAPESLLIGLDLSEPMIRQARQALPGENEPPRLRFLVADAGRLPFADAAFDLVLSSATLHHVGDPIAYFNEIDRVLAPDGHAIVSDLRRNAPRWLWPLVWLADRYEIWRRPRQARSIPEGIANSFRASYTDDEIRALLARSALGRRARHYPRLLLHWIQTPAANERAAASRRSERDDAPA